MTHAAAFAVLSLALAAPSPDSPGAKLSPPEPPKIEVLGSATRVESRTASDPARPHRPLSRPNALMPLYVSFGSLQALDVHSTRRALDRGGVEANPLVKGLSGNAFTLSAVKAAGTAGLFFATEKMWRRNKAAAVVLMAAANAGMTYVVWHNYRVGSKRH
jgi:hypothetical protein